MRAYNPNRLTDKHILPINQNVLPIWSGAQRIIIPATKMKFRKNNGLITVYYEVAEDKNFN